MCACACCTTPDNIHLASSDQPDTLSALQSVFRSGLRSPDVRQRGNRRPLNRRLHKHPCAAALSSTPSSLFIFLFLCTTTLGRYTDRDRELLFTVKLDQLQSKITPFPSSPMKKKASLSQPPLNRRLQLVSSQKMPGNAGKPPHPHSPPSSPPPPPSSELPSPRTNNRRISVFTGIMTQSAVRLAASSDRKFYLAMG